MSKWIRVEDYTPQHNEWVLIWGPMGGGSCQGYMDKNHVLNQFEWFDSSHNQHEDITHWMPLPEPPQVSTDE